MSNFTLRQMNNTNKRNGFLSSAPRSFRIMFGIVTSFIALTFIATIIFMATMFTSGNGFSYKVDYQFGNSSYSEEYSYGN